MPFTSLDDFSDLDKAKLSHALNRDRWANQYLCRLLDLLKPEQVFVLGRSNVEMFSKLHNLLSLKHAYSSGEAKATYGNMSFTGWEQKRQRNRHIM